MSPWMWWLPDICPVACIHPRRKYMPESQAASMMFTQIPSGLNFLCRGFLALVERNSALILDIMTRLFVRTPGLILEFNCIFTNVKKSNVPPCTVRLCSRDPILSRLWKTSPRSSWSSPSKSSQGFPPPSRSSWGAVWWASRPLPWLCLLRLWFWVARGTRTEQGTSGRTPLPPRRISSSHLGPRLFPAISHGESAYLPSRKVQTKMAGLKTDVPSCRPPWWEHRRSNPISCTCSNVPTSATMRNSARPRTTFRICTIPCDRGRFSW